MSGRPKAGQRPQCAQSGPCLAPRIRKGDTQQSQCRNCARAPEKLISLGHWIDRHGIFHAPFTHPFLIKCWAYITAHPDQNPFPEYFERSQESWLLLVVAKRCRPALLNIDPALLSFDLKEFGDLEDTEALKSTISQLFQLAIDPADTFQSTYSNCLQDFLYCKRHSIVPSLARLAPLLHQRQFEKAQTLIRQHEKSTGIRATNARVYYNTQLRKLKSGH